MTFRNIDEYDEYITQINDEHWEQMTMKADDLEAFRQAMNKVDDEIEADHGGPMLPTDPGYEYVNKPKHYDWFDMQAIDAIAKILTHEQLKGFLMGTALRYRLRMGTKPNEPIERDIKKAEWYENYWHQYVIDNTP